MTLRYAGFGTYYSANRCPNCGAEVVIDYDGDEAYCVACDFSTREYGEFIDGDDKESLRELPTDNA